MELPGRSLSCLLAKPAVPPSGNLAFLLQEMRIDTNDCGKSFSPLFHVIHSCPKEEQRGETNPQTQRHRSKETTHTHTHTHTQSSWRNYHAQIAAKVLVCPLSTHRPLLPLAFLALATPVRCSVMPFAVPKRYKDPGSSLEQLIWLNKRWPCFWLCPQRNWLISTELSQAAKLWGFFSSLLLFVSSSLGS